MADPIGIDFGAWFSNGYLSSMTEMANPAIAPVPSSKFETFLLASIGDDSAENGMQLSVLSALARLNLDPWEEAAHLACLPSETAIQKLTLLIAVLPKGRSMRPDPGANAARLIALLPRRASPDAKARTTMLRLEAGHSWHARRVMVYVISLVVMLVLQWFVASHLVPSPGNPHASPTTSTVPTPTTQLRNAGQ